MDDQPVCEETGQSETQLRRIDGQTIRIVRLKLFDYSHENLEKVCRVNKIYFNETTTKRNFRKALEDLLEGDTLEGWERHRAEHLLGEVKKETEINEKRAADHRRAANESKKRKRMQAENRYPQGNISSRIVVNATDRCNLTFSADGLEDGGKSSQRSGSQSYGRNDARGGYGQSAQHQYNALRSLDSSAAIGEEYSDDEESPYAASKRARRESLDLRFSDEDQAEAARFNNGGGARAAAHPGPAHVARAAFAGLDPSQKKTTTAAERNMYTLNNCNTKVLVNASNRSRVSFSADTSDDGPGSNQQTGSQYYDANHCRGRSARGKQVEATSAHFQKLIAAGDEGLTDEDDTLAVPSKQARRQSLDLRFPDEDQAKAEAFNDPAGAPPATGVPLADLDPNQDAPGAALPMGAKTPEVIAADRAVDAAEARLEAAEAEVVRLRGEVNRVDRNNVPQILAASKACKPAEARRDQAKVAFWAAWGRQQQLQGGASASSAALSASCIPAPSSQRTADSLGVRSPLGVSATSNFGAGTAASHGENARARAPQSRQVHAAPAITPTAPPLQQISPPLVDRSASPHPAAPLVTRPQQFRPAPLNGTDATGKSVIHPHGSSPRPFNRVHNKTSEQNLSPSTAPFPRGNFEIGGNAAVPVIRSGGRARMSGTTAVGNLMNEREHFNMGGADDRVRGTRLGEAAPKGPSEKADGGIRAGSEAVGAMAGNGSAYGQALEPEAEELEEGEICLDEEQRSEEIPGRCAAVLGGGGTQMERGKDQLEAGIRDKRATDSSQRRSASAATVIAPLLPKTLFDRECKTHELHPPVETVDHFPEKLSVPSHAHEERGKQPPRDHNARAERSNADSAGKGEGHTTSIEARSATYLAPALRAKQTCPNPESTGAIEQRGAPLSPDTATPSSAPAPYIHLIRSGAFASIGSRAHMEDAHVTLDDVSRLLGSRHVEASGPAAFFGVFDGHGGRDAAEYAGKHLLENLLGDGGLPGDARGAFARSYLETDWEFKRACLDGKAEHSGTTALTALVIGKTLVVANAGDCRAVLCQKGRAVELSRDQKPGCESEMKRIVANGGFVEDGYLNGQLGVARAIGNWHMEDIKVKRQLIAEPEVKVWELGDEDEFLIVGCDGLWDVMSSGMAVDLARKRLQQYNDPVRCSQELVEEAVKRHSADNITVVTICFQRDPPVRLSTAAPGAMRKSLSVESLRALQEKLDIS